MPNRKRTSQDEPRAYGDAGSPSEVSAFKKGLIDISLDTIRARLDSKTITRKWKRDLVEAELARRIDDDEEEGASDDASDNAQDRPGAHTGSRKLVRWAAGAIIGGCVVILLYAAYEIVRM